MHVNLIYDKSFDIGQPALQALIRIYLVKVKECPQPADIWLH